MTARPWPPSRTGTLVTKDYPSDAHVLKLVAYFQIPHNRNQLMADILGVYEPPEHNLFAQISAAPD